ncbi:MAG TPA: prenyltransferase/squalene oxidase repeat-containing protein [Pirellulales bacterium]|nr:prenyltransferase/squalene oxidase repeat-containing protein [Pirellulales bacterium]
MLHESQPASATGPVPIASPALSDCFLPLPNQPTVAEPNSGQPLATALRQAIFRTQQWLLAQQQPDGFWVAELEGDTILESEFLLLLAFLGEEQSPLARKCARHLLEKQMADGGWTQYPGGQVDISASVKAYFALKLTGHDPAAHYMQRSRAAIMAGGGADAVNSFTRFYLALLGQIPYEACPNVPPEFLLLPSWFPVNLYSISAWSRTILVPLSIMSAFQPIRQIEPERGIRELFLRDPLTWPYPRCPGLKSSRRLVSWDRFFHATDKAFKYLQRHSLTPLRRFAVNSAKQWMVERFNGSEGLGAIFPPMVWAIVALRALGFDENSSEMQYCRQRLWGLVIEDETSARLQPCKSPVWDTALTLRALADSGLDGQHPAVERGIHWLLAQEIRTRGDWSRSVKAQPGGWCFEFANAYYPDLDDTAMVVMALHESDQNPALTETALPPNLRLIADATAPSMPDARRQALLRDDIAGATQRATHWMLAMQNRDGGWGAFDRNNTAEFLCHVPFADHNAMIDPSSPDLAGRVLESLSGRGRRLGDVAIDRAVAYLRQVQEADGSWFGRWGVNYIYGTWQSLTGLEAVGVPHDDPAIVAGSQWLIAHQQPSGGWGESADSYAYPNLRGQGRETASQTAWAVMGLIAAGRHNHPAALRGVNYLLAHQNVDGTWDETEFTGTGFPRVFYLRYHYYRIYFPLMALARWAKAAGKTDETS